jgi:hypothetical protein
MSDEALAPPRHEARDVGVRFTVQAVALLLLVLLGMIGLVAWLYPATIAERFVPARLPRRATPALQSSPRADMAAFYREEMQRLNGIGWTDKSTGRVHIPIADAMRKVAAEGIPGWPGPPP